MAGFHVRLCCADEGEVSNKAAARANKDALITISG
jgi:hypothetical protein